MKVEIKLKGDVFTIHIDGLLHLYICESILSVQSWSNQDKFFKIEYITKNQTILTEYDDKNKWIAILNSLNETL